MRDSFTHIGTPGGAVAMNVVSPLVDDRVMNSISPPGLTSSTTCRDEADSVSLSITPAFANVLVFCIDATRATIVASPLTAWCTYWNESAVPQMLSPAPRTVNVPFE